MHNASIIKKETEDNMIEYIILIVCSYTYNYTKVHINMINGIVSYSYIYIYV